MDPVFYAIAYLVGRYAWHKIFDPENKTVRPRTEVVVPRTEEGEPIPLIYGRCRVRAPVLAWIGTPHVQTGQDFFDTGGDITPVDNSNWWTCSMFFTIGIPFLDGDNHIHSMWTGERKFVKYTDNGVITNGVELSELTGEGGFEDSTRPCWMGTSYFDTEGCEQGNVEFLNGNSSQVLFDPSTDSPTTVAGRYMTVNTGNGPTQLQGNIPRAYVPAYRGYLSACLYRKVGNSIHWLIGNQPSVAQHSFEVSSYHPLAIFHDEQGATAPRIGQEENPVTVIFDILTRWLGIPVADIDGPNFYLCSVKLYEENNGYSRAVEKDSRADEILGEILQQIDAVLFQDTADGKIKLKLLRNDYDPRTIPIISRTNGCRFEPTGIGWADTPNKVRIVFPNRLKNYQDDSVEAQNLANLIANGMKANEVVIHMPGVCTSELAATIAARELGHLSQPLIAGTAYVDRTKYRANPGDAFKVVWTNPDISGIVFRVVNVDRGTREDGTIKLDLIQDSYFVWRSRIPYRDWISDITAVFDLDDFDILGG